MIIRYTPQLIEEYKKALDELSGKLCIKDKVQGSKDKVYVELTKEAENKCKALVKECDKEIAWYLKVDRIIAEDGKRTYKVTDCVMFPQIVTGTSVDVDQIKYAEWVADNDVSLFNGHAHSHVNMNVFSSGTDDDWQKMVTDGLTEGYYIFLIFNKKDEMFARVFDFDINEWFDDRDVVKIREATADTAWASELIKQMCSTPRPVINTSYNGHNKESSWYQNRLDFYDRWKDHDLWDDEPETKPKKNKEKPKAYKKVTNSWEQEGLDLGYME